jgi:ribose transport system ATP-binding protein
MTRHVQDVQAQCESTVMTTPLVEMRNISKAFPGVQALKDVSLAVHSGEVHMLVGQNGAGKSTLIKILYGAYRPDKGEFLLNGQPVHIESTRDASRLGIAVIFQEFSLVPFLDIAQNIFLGREFGGRIPGAVDRVRMHREARKILDELGVDLDTRTRPHQLGVAQQQMIEIAKALSQNARVLVMDEPTAAISDREIERLF